jgi:hypothetical protein
VWGAVVLAAAACQVGGTVETFAPAHQPAGVAVDLTLQGGRKTRGELLAVEDTALVVLAQDSVTLVSYGAIFDWRFSQVGALLERPPAPDLATKLRLLSRFPQGLTPALLGRLLAAHGQAALKVVTE